MTAFTLFHHHAELRLVVQHLCILGRPGHPGGCHTFSFLGWLG